LHAEEDKVFVQKKEKQRDKVFVNPIYLKESKAFFKTANIYSTEAILQRRVTNNFIHGEVFSLFTNEHIDFIILERKTRKSTD
jgi:hypothetical protein